jgi:hypothetical protein
VKSHYYFVVLKPLYVSMYHVRKGAVPKQQLAALAWQGARIHGRWMWIHFLLSNQSVWSRIPPTCHICHRQIFPLPEGERVLKGRRFNDISDIELGVTELLKGIELQDFQRTFEDLCKWSQCLIWCFSDLAW